MEKLIELLNEYNDNKEGTRIGFITTIQIDGVSTPYELGKSDLLRREDKIISKKFGFIKWLVENEKIDFSWEGKLSSELVNLFERKLDNAEGVIALLSIQDNPIEFLVSILK